MTVPSYVLPRETYIRYDGKARNYIIDRHEKSVIISVTEWQQWLANGTLAEKIEQRFEEE